MITCIGIDLAWSPRNLTGAAVIVGDASGGVCIDHALLHDDDAITAYIARHAGDGPALVAVDAPLAVPNASGRRPVEGEISRIFRSYQAGPHPANRQLLTFEGVVRGEALVAALAAHDFAHTMGIAAGALVRQVVEVFPHPAMIALFGLPRTLKYKARPRRSLALRVSEWGRYQAYLRGLAIADPPLRGHEALLTQDVSALAGRRLKQYEDQIDALLCAYIALYGFRWGDARCHAFGTLAAGSIFTPLPDELRNMRDRLISVKREA
jgi:predicted RNase H-like nuclease